VAAPGSRAAVVLLLPDPEHEPVARELRDAGFEPIRAHDTDEFEALVASRRDVAVGVVDLEDDLDAGLTAWSALHASGRRIPALLVVNAATLERIASAASGEESDEYLTRPYSAESIRWRVEAMCIRSIAVDDGSGPVLQGSIDPGNWSRRGQLVAVFNPKGGVGKTMIATNLSAALVARGRRVLLVDADTVTGHVPTSLGMEGVPTVVDAWRDELEGGPVLSFDEQASVHTSGLKILPMTSHPINTELLEPGRVASALSVAQRSVDFVIVDLHPSYSPLNRAVFDRADQILVPVTPDVPAIRVAVRLREIAEELGMRDRLTLIVNRANTGVAVADIEKAIGLPAYATIRSAGLLLVRANNEGRTIIELAPRDKIAQDFYGLADRLLGVAETDSMRAPMRLFGRALVARS
jgi:Flp pilus assembly CpaE family ATPase